MKNAKGSVTIETAISLIAVMSVMLTLNIFMKVTLIHSVIQHSLVQAANEIATYDYLMSLLGITEINNSAESLINASEEDINTKVNSIEESMSKVTNLFDFGVDATTSTTTDENGNEVENVTLNGILEGSQAVTPDDISNISLSSSLEDLQGQLGDTLETLEIVDSDGNYNFIGALKTFLKDSLISLVGEGYRDGKRVILNEITRGLMSTYLNDSSSDTAIDNSSKKLLNSYVFNDLDKEQKKNGLKALDFSNSRFFEAPESEQMEICCTYYVKVISPIPIIEYVPLINNVKARAWVDDWETIEVQAKEFNDSIWYTNVGVKVMNVYENDIPIKDPCTGNTKGGYRQCDKETGTAVAAQAINFTHNENWDGISAPPNDGGSTRQYGEDIIKNAIRTKVNNMKNNDKIGDITINEKILYVYVPDPSASESSSWAKLLAEEQKKEAAEQDNAKISKYKKLISAEKRHLKERMSETKSVIEALNNELKADNIKIVLKTSKGY